MAEQARGWSCAGHGVLPGYHCSVLFIGVFSLLFSLYWCDVVVALSLLLGTGLRRARRGAVPDRGEPWFPPRMLCPSLKAGMAEQARDEAAAGTACCLVIIVLLS